jgi:nucleotide-binding universal stress UspA family protein
MYGRILVPTDGSDASIAALDEAIELANEQGAELHLLAVSEPPEMVSMGSGSADVVDSVREGTRRALDRAVEHAEEAGVADPVSATESGTAHEAIVSYVEENDVDLVVMGTHGRSGLDRVLLGSVTGKVVRLSPVPVLTVGPKQQ